ncbi:hypothetical protein BC826DRAFT_612212 [Russula brevipes]|nr:hypothetical protein BC826DRAFT_612212 [Russula brevipes]
MRPSIGSKWVIGSRGAASSHVSGTVSALCGCEQSVSSTGPRSRSQNTSVIPLGHSSNTNMSTNNINGICADRSIRATSLPTMHVNISWQGRVQGSTASATCSELTGTSSTRSSPGALEGQLLFQCIHCAHVDGPKYLHHVTVVRNPHVSVLRHSSAVTHMSTSCSHLAFPLTC